MKVALLADVHGNSDALRAVLRSAGTDGVDRLLVAGDLVGYYYDVAGVLAQLDEWPWDGVRGNHEDMLGALRAGRGADDVRRRYGSALEHSCNVLDEATIDRLLALPHPLYLDIAGRSVAVCHGTPGMIDRYVYPDADDETLELLLNHPRSVDLVLYGHTHHPVVWTRDGTTIVNPGSVGQPRDRIPGACWALWDAETGAVELRREDYDTGPLIAECRRRDPETPYLADVLARRR